MVRNGKIRILAKVFVLVLFMLGTAYGIAAWSVGHSIRTISARAQEENSGDRIDSLLAVLHSGTSDVRAKKQVVWALGEIRDARALPSLTCLSTGDECDHDRCVCQYEVQKAIGKIRGTIPDPYPWQW